MWLNTNVCVPHPLGVIASLLGTVQQRGIHLKSQFQPRSRSFPLVFHQKFPLKGRREGKGLQIPSEDELLKEVGR